MDKSTIRNHYIKLRNNLSKQYIDDVSYNITTNIINNNIYKQSENIFVYLTMNSEINTTFLINQSIIDNKNVYCPFMTPQKRTMVFKKFDGFHNLTKNSFGIFEPNSNTICQSDKNTLIIVPAIIYTKDKYRIGYGGGYYDYFLSNNEYLCTIGTCFDEFLINNFPKNQYDKKVDLIATQTKLI